MPVESVPSWRPAPGLVVAPEPRPAEVARPTVATLERTEMARRDLVDPLLRSSRSAIAALALKARTAEQEALRAEARVDAGPDADGQIERGTAQRAAQVDAELWARRRQLEESVAAARRDAEELLSAARDGSAALVAAARDELDRSLAMLPGAPVPAVALPAVDTSSTLTEPTEPSVPTPEPPVAPQPDLPPAASAPSYPPPATPAPNVAPPVVGLPTAAMTYSTVLVQGADGTLQPAYLLNAPGPMLAGPVGPTMLPAAGPAPVVAPTTTSPGATSVGRRLLHLDVILPLLAVLIVLVVLLAWLG